MDLIPLPDRLAHCDHLPSGGELGGQFILRRAAGEVADAEQLLPVQGAGVGVELGILRRKQVIAAVDDDLVFVPQAVITSAAASTGKRVFLISFFSGFGNYSVFETHRKENFFIFARPRLNFVFYG